MSTALAMCPAAHISSPAATTSTTTTTAAAPAAEGPSTMSPPHRTQAPSVPHPPDVGTPGVRQLRERFANTLPPHDPRIDPLIHQAPWDGTERRAARDQRRTTDEATACSAACFDAMRAYLDEASTAILRHMDGRFSDVESLIKSGFPNGDPAAHRAVHEGYIEQAHKRRRMWENILEKTVTGGVWVTIAWLAAAVWSHFKNEVQR